MPNVSQEQKSVKHGSLQIVMLMPAYAHTCFPHPWGLHSRRHCGRVCQHAACDQHKPKCKAWQQPTGDSSSGSHNVACSTLQCSVQQVVPSLLIETICAVYDGTDVCTDISARQVKEFAMLDSVHRRHGTLASGPIGCRRCTQLCKLQAHAVLLS